MAYVNPALRELFEQIPIEIKNRILEAEAVIETAAELQMYVQRFKKPKH